MTLTPRTIEKDDLRPLDRMTLADLLLLGGYDSTDVLAEVLKRLFEALDRGIISIDLTPTRRSINNREDLCHKRITVADRFLTRYRQGCYDALVAMAPAVAKPLVLLESEGRWRLYFQKYYFHESRVKQQINAFISVDAAPVAENPGLLIQNLYETQRALRKGPQMPPLVIDEYQVAAIRKALQYPLTIISGGPGTGKTTVVANLLRCLAGCGIAPEQMLLTAPTGRAAQRITETLQALLQSVMAPTPEDVALKAAQAQTLHAALGYRHPGQFRYSFNNPLPKAVVIMDEASMVDVVLMSRFISALDHSTTRLVLLGDPDQLPAVAAGSVFTRLSTPDQDSNRRSGAHAVLEQGYRAGSELTRLAQQIRQGSFPDHQPVAVEAVFSNKSVKPWCRLTPVDLKNWSTALKAWARFYQTNFDQKSRSALDHLRQRPVVAFSQPDKSLLTAATQLLEHTIMARILTLVRKGPWGCEDINGFLKPLLADNLDRGGDPDSGIFAGMPLMITRNDSENGLYNGDVGIVVVLKEGYYAVFRTSGQNVALPINHLAAWEPALAITVHKSQGSEYKHLFLVLPDDPSHRLLSREMIYTAVTRAQKQLVLWADEKVLQQAVTQKALGQVDSILN